MTVYCCRQAALEGQKGKLEADIARHLAFIDRLLCDKDQLSAKCEQLGRDIKVSPWGILASS